MSTPDTPRYDKPGNVQRQDSLTDQMRRVHRLAHQHGEWDAADWIARTYWGENTSPEQVTEQARDTR